MLAGKDACNMNIRRRILLPMVILAIGCSAALLISSLLIFSRDLTNSSYDRVNIAHAKVEHEIQSLLNSAHSAAVGMAGNPEIRNALINRDRERMLMTTLSLRTIAQLDYLTIVDSEGIVFQRSHEPDNFDDSLAHLPHIVSALEGNIDNFITAGGLVRLGVSSGAPIYDENMNIIGAISLGYRLDSQAFVNELKVVTAKDIAFYRDDECVATTVVTESGSFAVGTRADRSVSEHVLSGESFIGEMQVLGIDTISKYTPLIGAGGEIVGMVFVGEYTSDNLDKIRALTINGLIMSPIVLAACIAVALLISRSIERKVEKLTAEAQKAVEERDMLSSLGSILDGLDEMIYVTDTSTDEILFISDAMKRHYDVGDDSIGQRCYKVFQKDMTARCDFCPCYQLEKEPDTAITWEETNTKTERTYRNIDRYIDWPNGKKVHLQYSVDMTELISAKEAAEQSNRAKGIFLASMSHEVRTPMNAILGISEIQLYDGALLPDTAEAFRKISDSGNQLLNVINDILDFSKIDAGKLELVPCSYDVPSLINDATALNRLKYENKPIDFKLEIDKNTPLQLFGDELRIRQILNNILSNAFKYTDEGVVTLSVFSEPGENESSVTLVMCISDTGQGMRSDQIERLFDEYSRFNLEKNRDISGTGLGMSITKRLIDMMQGELLVESQPGKGSVFTLRLPQERVDSAVCGAELAEKLQNFSYVGTAHSERRNIKYEHMPYGSVLVVDDVEINIYVAKGMLNPYGLRVDAARSGSEAISKIENGNVYDIIFMDHLMPAMDGMKATTLIRGMGYTSPIVALTANAIIGQAEVFLANGFDGFISKPIDSNELNRVLREFVKRDAQPETMNVPDILRQGQGQEHNDAETLLTEFFLMDAEDTITVLENICAKPELSDADMDRYVIAVHGIKSALANICETELAAFAHRLEQAGENRELYLVKDETPLFIKALEELIDKLK